uniref:Zonadhesin n=1 Tax=Strongyloides papillosus TaxID=174720 RepID=A0A0N5B340_STREA
MLPRHQNPLKRPPPKLQKRIGPQLKPPVRPQQRRNQKPQPPLKPHSPPRPQQGPNLRSKPMNPSRTNSLLASKSQSKLSVRPLQRSIQKRQSPLKPKLGPPKHQPLRHNPSPVLKLVQRQNQRQQSPPMQKSTPLLRPKPKQNSPRSLALKPMNQRLKTQPLLNRRMNQSNANQMKIKKLQQLRNNKKSLQESGIPQVIRRHLPPFRLLNSRMRQQQQRNRLLQKQRQRLQQQNSRLLQRQRRRRQQQRNRLLQRQKKNQQRTRFLQRQRQQNQARRAQTRMRNNLRRRIRKINRLKRIFTQRRARLQQRINRLKALLRRQKRPVQIRKTTKKPVAKPNPPVVPTKKPSDVNPGGEGIKVPVVVTPKPGGGALIPGVVVVPGQTGDLEKDEIVGNDAAESGAIEGETDDSNDDIEI